MNKKERLAIEKASSPIESLIAKMMAANRKMIYPDDELHWYNEKYDRTGYRHVTVRLQFYMRKTTIQTLPVLTDEEDDILRQHISRPEYRSITKPVMDSVIRKLMCTMMIHETQDL
jgi:hypothetical protein